MRALSHGLNYWEALGNAGAAYAFLLLVLCIGFMSLVMKVFKVGLGDIAK